MVKCRGPKLPIKYVIEPQKNKHIWIRLKPKKIMWLAPTFSITWIFLIFLDHLLFQSISNNIFLKVRFYNVEKYIFPAFGVPGGLKVFPLMTVSLISRNPLISIAPQKLTSPSPWEKCMSPMDKFAPGTNTGK